MNRVRFRSGEQIPLEMHKARMVQKVNLLPVEQRRKAMLDAGHNTFLLRNKDVFLDMLTDSGVNAMSEKQYGAMMLADDSYAGSESFFRLEEAVKKMFGMRHFLPAHQGRACENIIARALVTPGSVALMNYHFTTTKALITSVGGTVEELVSGEGRKVESSCDFKGDIDIEKLKEAIRRLGKDGISFVRIEAGTNLIGGQPVSMKNMREASDLCREARIPLVLDASLLADNLYFIKTRDQAFMDTDIREITREMGCLFDVIYFSGRKLGCARGGGICTSDDSLFCQMRALIPLFEGFITYGGMSVREMEAMAVGLEETMDMDVIEQTPIFVEALSTGLRKHGVPVVLPPGGLGCHVDASGFCPHIPQDMYPAGALASAIFVVSGIRAMERGTMSEQRDPDGSEHLSEMELVRLAVPKRVFTLSHIKYAADRIAWLYENRDAIGGLRFTEEPPVLRFFFGRLQEDGGWTEELVKRFRRDFGDSL